MLCYLLFHSYYCLRQYGIVVEAQVLESGNTGFDSRLCIYQLSLPVSLSGLTSVIYKMQVITLPTSEGH